ncbi:MAG: HAD-IIB family hydrolase [Gallionella sp.]|nr:HAD-IIB family hydrolase [Gallionella sp.]
MPISIIFSDLDGTLLDPVDYSFAAALPALEAIRTQDVPLILCSSKTRAEIEVYRQRLNNEHPFITENGGGIFIPQDYFSFHIEGEAFGDYLLIKLGTPYAEIRRQFVQLRERLSAKARGFADMTDMEVSALTGLPPGEAVLAKQRDFDEVFVFDGAPDETFLKAIEATGLHWTQGQFFHILGDHDKGRAVNLLQSLYRREFGAVASIGLGDSLNDLPMHEAVNRPVLVRHADGSFDARIDLPGLLKTQRPGPSGWNDAVLHILAVAPASAGTGRQTLIEIYNAALAAADPYHAVFNAVKLEDDRLHVAGAAYDLAAYERIVVVGVGKASARMALAVEELLGERVSAGLVIVKEGHQALLRRIEQIEASHPVPDEAGIEGTRRMLDMLRAADAKTLVICLFSGGASALLVAPADGVTLEDKQQATGLLLNAGASIAELNVVRKHLSAVKGGRLAQAAWPAQVLTLLLSDVIGDRLDVIASGPTAPDESSFDYAWAVIEKYGLQEKFSARVNDYLRRGMAGLEAETLKDGAPCLAVTRNFIVGSIELALAAAAEKARRLGYAAEIVSAGLEGEARTAAQFLAQRARATLAGMESGGRRCLLSGGETTVAVHGAGKGGRNQELALAFALEIDGLGGITLLSAGTDGTDGPTDAAGAIVDGGTAAAARRLGLDPVEYLERNDSYSFFHRFDEASDAQSHLITGPTGTNVMDMQVMLCDKKADVVVEEEACKP